MCVSEEAGRSRGGNTEGCLLLQKGFTPNSSWGLPQANLLSFPFGGTCMYFDEYGWLVLLKNNLSQVSSLVRQFGTETCQDLSRFSGTSAGAAPHNRTLPSRVCSQPLAAPGRKFLPHLWVAPMRLHQATKDLVQDGSLFPERH